MPFFLSFAEEMIKKIFGLFFLVLFITISLNKVSNWHTHLVNGHSVQHAHPFNHASNNPHSHSRSQIISIQLLNGIFLEDVSIPQIPLVTETAYERLDFFKSDLEISVRIYISNKAPPLS